MAQESSGSIPNIPKTWRTIIDQVVEHQLGNHHGPTIQQLTRNPEVNKLVDAGLLFENKDRRFLVTLLGLQYYSASTTILQLCDQVLKAAQIQYSTNRALYVQFSTVKKWERIRADSSLFVILGALSKTRVVTQIEFDAQGKSIRAIEFTGYIAEYSTHEELLGDLNLEFRAYLVDKHLSEEGEDPDSSQTTEKGTIGSGPRDRKPLLRPVPGEVPPAAEAQESSLSDKQVILNRDIWAGDQALRVGEYAEALARVLGSVDVKEVTFAIFGHWGRGKTYFMKQVQKRLESSATPYQTVWFSAWKYRATPELWAHLYENFVDEAKKGGWFSGVARTVRANIAKHGHGKLLVSLFFVALTILPVVRWLWTLAPVLIAFLGVAGLTRMVFVSRTASKAAKRIAKSYLSSTSHRETLGIQGTISEDLQALLRGWIPKAGLTKHPKKLLTLWYFLAVSAIALAIYAGFAITEDIEQPLLNLTGIQWNPHKTVVWIIISAWVLVFSVITLLVNFLGRKTERILLIVDDLDRCDPEQMLEIIESLKLMLEDPVIHDRVQIVMLMEEGVLRREVHRKYSQLLESVDGKGKTSEYLPSRVFQENLEKLFVGHLRLPPLGKDELEEIMSVFVNQPSREVEAIAAVLDKLKQERKELASNPQKRLIKPDPRRSGELQVDRSTMGNEYDAKRLREIEEEIAKLELSKEEKQIRENIKESSRESEKILFSPDERKALLDIVENIHSKKEGSVPGPRSLQSFLVRFQLARLLLQIRGANPTPTQLATSLAEAWSQTGKIDIPAHYKLYGNGEDSKHLLAVLREVA